MNKIGSLTRGMSHTRRSNIPLLVLVGLLAGIGATPWLAARVRSAVQEPGTIAFAAIGDFGSDNENELAVAYLVKSWDPDFIITLGDNNYQSGEAVTIDANIGQYYHEYIYPYQGTYGAGASTNRFWPSVGNRDWDNQTGAKLEPYLDYFTLPNNERYYDFVRGPVHFFSLDSDIEEPDGIISTSTQAQWLQNKLAASTAPWKIVYLHHPPYSSRYPSPDSFTKLRWPFQAWGADAVLSGHAHVYERVMKNGLPYFTNGLGGDSISSFTSVISGSVVRFADDFGAMKMTASAAVLTFQFFTVKGELVDTYTIGQQASVPAAPSNLTASASGSSQINLTWTDNAGNEDGFQVERCAGAGCTNFLQVTQVGADVTAYANSGLAAGTTYRYRVHAFNGSGPSGYSNVAETTTTSSSKPAAPSNLVATAVSSSQIDLVWVDNSTNEDGFKLYRSTDGVTFTRTATLGPDATSYSNTGRPASTTYYYRVLAYNGFGNSANSNTVSVTTLPANVKPAAPSNLVAMAVSSSRIDLVWVDNSTNEDGFKLYRSTDGVTFTRTATLGPDATSFSSTGRPASTTYYYRVLAYNSHGNSAYSNTVSATTFAANAKRATPGNLIATANSGIRLAWTDNSNDEEGLKLHQWPDWQYLYRDRQARPVREYDLLLPRLRLQRRR